MDLHLLRFRILLKYVIATVLLSTLLAANLQAQVTLTSLFHGDFINGQSGNFVLDGNAGTGPNFYQPHIGNITQLATLDANGDVAFCLQDRTSIMRITGTRVITYPAVGPYSLAFDRDNEFIYAAAKVSVNAIYRYIWKNTGVNTSMGYFAQPNIAIGTSTSQVAQIPFLTTGEKVFLNGATTTSMLPLGIISQGLAFDATGNLYYLDNTNSVLRKISIEKATPVITPAGSTNITLTAAPSAAVRVDDKVSGIYIPAGTYITAINGNTITISNPLTGGGLDGTSTIAFITGVSDIAGTAGTAGSPPTAVSPLPATAGDPGVLLKLPQGLTFDPSGNLFISDQYSLATARILKIEAPVTKTSAISVFEAGGTNGISTIIYGIATDAAGNLYIGDRGNQKIVKVSPSGGMASIIIGSGTNVPIAATAAAPYTINPGSPVITTGDLADLQKVTVGMKIRGTGIPYGSTVTAVNTQTAPYTFTLSNPCGITVVTPDGTAAKGSTTLTVSAPGSIVVGQYVAGAGIPANTAVSAITGSTITLSAPTTAALNNTQLFFYAGATFATPVVATSGSLSLTSADGFVASNGSYGYIENPFGIAVSQDANNPYILYAEQYQNYIRKISGGGLTTATNLPTITSVTPVTVVAPPATVAAGTTVTISGTNFTGATNVNFGGIDAASFTVGDANTISAVMGTGTNGTVFVTTPSGTAYSLTALKVTPTITSFTPTSGVAGATVTITGTNFIGAGTPIVKFGGTVAASFTVNSNTTITAIAGAGATGPISVQTNASTATSTGTFAFTTVPTAVSYTPNTATTGYGTAGASVAPAPATPNGLTYTLSPAPPAGITINAATGIISYSNAVVPGSYPFTVTATNALGNVTTTYTVTVQALVPTTLVYSTASLTAIRGTTGKSVAPTINAGGATITYSLTGTVPGGVTIDPATGVVSYDKTLMVGTYPLTITATNITGSTTTAYSITINPSPDSTLGNLAISAGTLTPAFNSTTTSYAVGVPLATSSVTFTPTVSDAFATVQVNGVTTTSGNASAPVTIAAGSNNVNIVVTAQDGTTKTYTINVVATSASNNARLASMVLNNGATLNPAFAANTIGYKVTVPNLTTSITITPTLADATATQTVNNVALSSGATSAPIALAVGDNVINTVVKAQDGVTVVTYTVTITRIPSSNSSLSGLVVSNSSLSPAFAPGTLTYTATIANTITSVTLTPTIAEPNATIKINGVTSPSGSASASIALSVGDNPATIAVTAQDGSITTYNVDLIKLGLPQTITFAALTPATYGKTDFAAGATSTNSTVPLTYSSSNTAVATIAADGTIHILNAGSTDITVSQSRNSVYAEATPITQTLKVNPAPLTFTADDQTKTFGGVNPALTYQYSGFVNNEDITVLTTQPVISTTAITTSAVGPYPITVSAATAKNYAITFVPGTLTINKGIRTLTFAALATKTYLDPDFALTASLTTGEPIIYTTSDPTILTITNGIVHILTPGTATITATAPVNGNYSTTPTIAQAQVVFKLSQTITFAPIPLQLKGSSLALVATSSSGLPVTFTTSDSKIANIDNQNVNFLAAGAAALTAVQAGNNLYYAATLSQVVTVQDNLVTVHTGVSPNGDGINDHLVIDRISNYPDNKFTLVNGNGVKMFQTSGYNNDSNNFDGHGMNGNLMPAGTYFYELHINDGGATKRVAGYIILKYN